MSNQADYYGKCRSECEGKPNTYQCIQDCLDQPLVDMVTEEYGPHIGQSCYGYNVRLREAMYRYSPEHLATASRKAKQVPATQHDLALRYYKQPIAPYPPRSSAPRGIRNAQPDYKKLLEFIKDDPCDKYRFLSEARKSLGADDVADQKKEPILKPALSWKGYVGGAAILWGLYHFYFR